MTPKTKTANTLFTDTVLTSVTYVKLCIMMDREYLNP